LKERVEEISWASAVIVVIIYTIVESLMSDLAVVSPIKSRYMWGIQGGGSLLPFGAVFLPLIAYAILRILKYEPSPTYLAYLFTIGLMSSHALSYHSSIAPWNIQFADHRAFDEINLLDLWWIPPKDVCVKFVAGGVGVDWIAWTPSIIYWTVHCIVIYFLFSSIVLIFRRLWIDVERLPFPIVFAGYSTIDALTTKDKGKIRSFLIGMIVALALELPIIFAGLFPWFPDIYGWRTYTCQCGGVQIIPRGPVTESVVGLTMVNKNPLTYALFYLAPLSVLFNIWFWYLILVILVQIAYYFGYYTGILTETYGCCRVMGGSVNLANSSPFRWDLLTGIGGVLGFIILFLFNNKSYIAETIKAALGRPSELSKYEKSEPLSYRAMYIIFIVSLVLAIAVLMVAGVNVGSAIAVLIPLGIVNYFIAVLTLGYTGYSQGWTLAFQRSGWALRFVYPEFPKQPTTDYVLSAFFAYKLATNSETWNSGMEGPAYALSMASYAKIDNKKTYLLSTVSYIIALPVVMIVAIATASTYGPTRLGFLGRCPIEQGPCFNWGIQMLPETPELISYILTGALITAIISILRARFVWFPFEPIGFIIATTASGMYLGLWAAALVIWIIKTIVLKIGGSRLYEKTVPVIGGYLAGYIVSSTIATLLGVIRFFIPF
jgi:hypothetical protein